MFKSRLFWRVVSNFFLLLAILSAMTVLTLLILTQIERSFKLAAVNLRGVESLDRLRGFLVEVPRAADAYLYTSSPEQKRLYETGWKEFDIELATAQRLMPDSSDQDDLKRVRTLFYSWIAHVGDRKIILADSGLHGADLERELRLLADVEQRIRYLETAREALEIMYRSNVESIPTNIDNGVRKARDIGTLITWINVLVAVFSIALGFFLTKSIITPVELLRRGTRGIMTDDFEPIEMKRKDEFGELANDFNRMSVMLQSNYTRLTAYSELMTTLNRYESLQEVETKSLEILCTHTHSSVGALYLLDLNKGVLKLASGYALKDWVSIQEYRLGQGIPGQCASLNRTLEITNVGGSSDFVIETGIVSVVPTTILAAPIVFQDNVIGVVILGSTQPFDELRREIINNSIPQIGVAIMNAMNNDATKKLSREIATKNQELNGKNAELQKAYRVKSDFLSNMSHELRTPLNSIIGFTSVMLGPHGDPLTPDQKKAMEKVLKNGRHLLQLINDILDFSKIESGRASVNIDTEEVSNVIGTALVSVEPMVNAKGVKLVQEVDPNLPLLNTDILKVKQILLNLLSNAAKFTEQGTITVTAKKVNEQAISISVKDSGIGIEAKNLDKVFEEFQQIDSSSSRKYKGTGLGLPIARSYARILGGDLTVQSTIGKGSTFTLTFPPVFPKERLPKAESALAPKPAPAMPTSPAEPPKTVPPPAGEGATLVLCIDDEPEVIELLQRYLAPEGYSVRGALDGDEGMKLAEELNPAVITLDIMMPKKDGWQVLRELKANPKTKEIPVIIHSVIDNKPLAVSLGALDILPKPSEAKRILEIVNRAMKSKEHRILIVDDNEDFANYVQVILRQEGYLTAVAFSGEEALKAVNDAMPALIFLDLTMPGMDGFEVVRRLRMRPEWKDIPVVILSGKELNKEERDTLNLHIQEFIEKGHFSREAITSTLKRIIPRPPTA